MHTDPIADLLTRIRNAYTAHHEEVSVSHSKIKESIVKILKEHNFVEDYETEEQGGFKILNIMLKDNLSDLTFKKVSKPGQRIYVKNADLKAVKSGLGLCIVSTSKGLMTNSDAKRQKLGGELICEIY
jgi:small subunit ribosomal protein S8